MRDYGKVSPQFWIGKTGKEIREKGHEALIVSMYLLTNPHANMIGMYYLPIIYMAHETGLGLEGASKGLLRCIEAGFCHYDDDAEVVWVIEMAKYQIASSLKPSDNRCIGIQREYDSQPKNQFLSMFYDKYKDAFNLSSARESSIKNKRGLEGALKTLPSQEQEQEQEQDIKPPKSPLKKKSVQKRGFNILEEKIPDWLNPEVWEKWIEYRKEIKHPIKSKQTFSGQIKLLTECYELGFSPEEIISKTITNGWQGLFKPNVSPPQRIIQPQKNDEFIPEDF